jgi:hypothetical protein
MVVKSAAPHMSPPGQFALEFGACLGNKSPYALAECGDIGNSEAGGRDWFEDADLGVGAAEQERALRDCRTRPGERQGEDRYPGLDREPERTIMEWQ